MTAGAGDNSSVFFTAVYNTTYYVAVGAGRNKTGTYKLLVEAVSADDYADNAGSVWVGGSATGAIETPGDRDRFAVALEGGKTYRVDIDETAIGGDRDFSSRLYDVRDARGTVLPRVTHDGNNRLYVRPGVDDTYTFEVGGISDDISQTGHYTLTVLAIDGSDEYAADTGTAGAVSVGGTAAARLNCRAMWTGSPSHSMPARCTRSRPRAASITRDAPGSVFVRYLCGP